jgi:hypothetical protein
MSEGEYQAGLDDPPAPEEQTIAELSTAIRTSSMVALESAFMIAELDENDVARAVVYKACRMFLGPHAKAETGQSDGQVAFTFTISADVLARLRNALTVRKMASETWGLIEAFLARILTCVEEGKFTHDFDRVKERT